MANDSQYLERAQTIHAAQPAVDLHLDLGMIVKLFRERGERRVLQHRFLDSWRQANFKVIVAAIFLEGADLERPFKSAMRQIAALLDDIDESHQHFCQIEQMEDLRYVLDSDKIGIIFSLEGAEPLERDIELITIFNKVGVRLCGLTWSRRNFVADGSYFKTKRPITGGGVTPFGFDVMNRLEKIGIAIDVSHLNRVGLNDVLNAVNRPLIASHSNAYSVNPIERNLKDEEIVAIAASGGIIGINGCGFIVSEEPGLQTIAGLVDHIAHILKLVGDDHIAYGFDLCRLLDETKSAVDVLYDHSETLKITTELLSRGFSASTCQKLLGANALKFLRKLLGDK